MIEKLLDEFVAIARNLRADHSDANIKKHLPRIRATFELLEYHAKYGSLRRPMEIKQPRPIQGIPKCSACEAPAVFNVAFAQGRANWRCAEHIPDNITFVVGKWRFDEEQGKLV